MFTQRPIFILFYFLVRHSRTTLITEASLHFGGFYWSPADCIEGLLSGRQLMILSVPAELWTSHIGLSTIFPRVDRKEGPTYTILHVHHTPAKYAACVVVCKGWAVHETLIESAWWSAAHFLYQWSFSGTEMTTTSIFSGSTSSEPPSQGLKKSGPRDVKIRLK